MNPNAVLMSAYALATQERFDEAEQLLESCPEAFHMVPGQDLLARIRLAQGQTDQARQIWDRILQLEPANPEARSALDALDHPIAVPSSPYRKFVIAGVITVVLGVVITIVGAINCSVSAVVAQEPNTVFVTNLVERVLANTIVKTESKVAEGENLVDRIVERVVKNTVDRTVEVPVVSVVTQYVDRVVEVAVPITNAGSVSSNHVKFVVVTLPPAESNTLAVVEKRDVDAAPPVSNAEVAKRLYCPSYIIKSGDQVGRLAQKFKFRMADFKAVNPDVDPNHIIPGQEVKLPGFYTEEDMQK